MRDWRGEEKQTQLAKRSLVSQSLISGLEQGKKNATMKKLDMLLRALGHTYSDLFSENEDWKDQYIAELRKKLEKYEQPWDQKERRGISLVPPSSSDGNT